MTDYSWKIDLMVCAKNLDGLTDVVREVKWFRIASAGEYAVSVSGTTAMSPPDPTAFIPFDQLTEQEVTAWLDTTVDTAEIDTLLDARLQETMTLPQEVILTPPWMTQPPSTNIGE